MWKQLIEGELALTCRDLVDQLATSLEPLRGDASSTALFWAYYSSLTQDPKHEALLEQALQRSLAALGTNPLPLRLHGGTLGTAWTVAHVLADPEHVAELLAEYDQFILAELNRPTLRGDEDVGLISGVAGVLLYATQRRAAGDEAFARPACEAAIRHLRRLARRSDGGIHWSIPVWSLGEEGQRRFPHGYSYCGPGHGVAGIISVLARAHQLGLADTSDLVLGGETWLASFDALTSASVSFPYLAQPHGPPAHPRWLAWCSGTLGTAVARWQAARAINAPYGPAMRHATGCTSVDQASLEVMDAGLCHGSLGHAVLFHWCWVQTNENEFKIAAEGWLAHALTLREPGGAFAGFTSYSDGKRYGHAGFIQGATGMGLALLAAIQPTYPGWIELLGVFDDGDATST